MDIKDSSLNMDNIAWGPLLEGFGTGLDFFGKLKSSDAFSAYGDVQQRAASNNAEQLRINAGQAEAASQYKALEVGRTGDVALSRAKALAAASGGNSADPTMVTIMARIQGAIDQNRQNALYQGKTEAQALQSKAAMADYEGRLAQWEAKQNSSAAKTSAWGGLLKGAIGMADKYGHGSPKESKTTDVYNMDSPIGAIGYSNG